MGYEERFLEYMLHERRCSPLTVSSYRKDLSLFDEFLRDRSVERVEDVLPKDIRQWIMQLMHDGMQPRSVNRKVATLKSFFRFLLQDGVIKKNPCSMVNSVKTAKKLPTFLEEGEMNDMLSPEYFQDDYEGVRDRAVLTTFYLTGMRRAELIGLTDAMVDFGRQVITVLGKRNKERIIPMTPVLISNLKSYLQRRNEMFGAGPSSGSFFLTAKGEPIYAQLVYRIVHKHIAMVSSVTKKSPHVLRHTFATVLLNNGAELMAIKELLGHTSLAATQVYTHSNFEQLNKIYKQAHPRAEN